MSTLVRVCRREPKALAPFGEPALKLDVVHRPLADHHQRLAQSLGLQLVDVEEGARLPDDTVLALGEDVFVNDEAGAWLRSQATSGVCQLAHAVGTPLFDWLQPLSGASSDTPLAVGVFAGALGGKCISSSAAGWMLNDDAVDTALLTDTGADEVRVAPAGPPPHVLRFPTTTLVAGDLRHWLHVLHVNHAELYAQRRLQGAVGGRNVMLGEAKVHPTAYVENSILEDGVEVEPGASVMNSWIGKNVKVADHAVLDRCVVGADCHTLIDTHMRRIVAYPGSTLSNLGTEDLLLGREIFITTGVAFFGGTPGQTVVVDGEDTRRASLGGVVGHHTTLGARSLFEGGVCVPSHMTIVGRPDEAIGRFTDAGLARAHAVFGNPNEDA